MYVFLFDNFDQTKLSFLFLFCFWICVHVYNLKERLLYGGKTRDPHISSWSLLSMPLYFLSVSLPFIYLFFFHISSFELFCFCWIGSCFLHGIWLFYVFSLWVFWIFSVRLSLRKNPVLRDRLFTIVLAGAFAHGFYLVYPFQISYVSCVTVQSDSAFLLLIDCIVNVLITIAALHRICCVAYENWRLLFSLLFIIILLWLPGCQITTTLLLFHDLGQARNKIYETKHRYKWSYFYSWFKNFAFVVFLNFLPCVSWVLGSWHND